jgi:hypothetical protein
MVQQAQQRAKKTRAPFAITWEDVVIPALCPLLGIPLLRDTHCKFHPNNPSLDRILPDKGYVPGNVWVISWRANVLKNNATLEEIERLAQFLRAKIFP